MSTTPISERRRELMETVSKAQATIDEHQVLVDNLNRVLGGHEATAPPKSLKPSQAGATPSPGGSSPASDVLHVYALLWHQREIHAGTSPVRSPRAAERYPVPVLGWGDLVETLGLEQERAMDILDDLEARGLLEKRDGGYSAVRWEDIPT